MFEFESYKKGDYYLDYAIDYPEGFDKTQKYPVIFYFHGMGGVRQGIKYVSENCPVRRERMNDDMPFIIVDPACMDFLWMEHFDGLVSFVEYVISLDYVDKSRVYMSGSSMGAYTCWLLAITHPDIFAAAAICCGGGVYALSDIIKFPVRIYHGLADDVVLPRESEIMAETINARGGRAELFLYEGVGHNVWNIAYTNPDTYYWLLEQRKQ